MGVNWSIRPGKNCANWLAATSGVPVPTLQKIRYGITENPGYETMRKVLPLVPNHKKREKRGVAKAGVVVHD